MSADAEEAAKAADAGTAQRPAMIVTGASRGIGAGIARKAAAAGYAVCVNYAASAERAQALVAEIAGAGGRAVAVRADVADPDDVDVLFETAERTLGPVRALVNNAGVSTLTKVVDAPVALIRDILGVNLLGPMFCTRRAVRAMSTAHGGQGGVILNISSIAAVHGGMPGDAIYAATKGGLDAFTLGMAKELGREGIRVCGLRPGITRTEIWDGEIDAARVEELGRATVPLGRIGEVEDMAEAALWLCSDQAGYVHGTVLTVSGGREIFVAS